MFHVLRLRVLLLLLWHNQLLYSLLIRCRREYKFLRAIIMSKSRRRTKQLQTLNRPTSQISSNIGIITAIRFKEIDRLVLEHLKLRWLLVNCLVASHVVDLEAAHVCIREVASVAVRLVRVVHDGNHSAFRLVYLVGLILVLGLGLLGPGGAGSTHFAILRVLN